MIRRLDPRHSVALMASAGTGKTHNLALRVVTTLMRGTSVAQELYDLTGDIRGTVTNYSGGKILCLTFTRKATAEMADRVNEYLAKLANGQLDETSGEYQEVARVLNIQSPADMQTRAREALARIYKDTNLLQVRTIDSFVGMILRLFPFEANVRPDFDTMDEQTAEKIRRQAFSTMFSILPNGARYRRLFRNYIEWADMRPGYFTDNLRQQVISILERSVTLERQLKEASRLTLDDLEQYMAGADTVAEDIRKALANLAAYLQREDLPYTPKKNLLAKLEIFASIAEGRTRINEIFNNLNVLDPDKKPFNGVKDDPLPEAYLRLYGDLCDSLCDYVLLLERLDVGILLHMAVLVQQVVDKIKLERGLLSFADITNAAYQMLHQPENPIPNDYLYFRIDGRLEHILVDEFQDTSDVQWKLLSPLADEAMAGMGQSEKIGSFFCVGDPKQTIYRFRGSNPSFFQNVVNDYRGKLDKEDLAENFRSDRQIVDFVNNLFTDANDYIQGGQEIYFDFMGQSAHSDKEGFVCLDVVTGENSQERTLKRFDVLESQIARAMNEGGWQAGDIAILVYKRDAGMAVQRFLENKGIKSYVSFEEKLAARPAYRIIAALVRYMYNRDAFALAEFFMTPPQLIPHKVMTYDGLYQSIAKELDEKLARTSRMPVYQRLLGLDGELCLAGRLMEDRDYSCLMDLIGAEIPHIVNPLEFLERLEALAAVKSVAVDDVREGIAIMTIHGSKGLQFPVVILHDINKEFIINNKTKYFIDELSAAGPTLRKRFTDKYARFAPQDYIDAREREMALTRYGVMNELYVAVTRAKHALFITTELQKGQNIDSYILQHYPGNFETGILEKAVRPVRPSKKDKGIYERYTDFCWHVIGAPITLVKEPETARKKLLQTLKEGPYDTEVKNRSLDYLDYLIDHPPVRSFEYGHEPYARRYYGSFVHEVIYQMENFACDMIDAAVYKAWNKYGGYLELWAIEECKNSVRALLDHPDWQGLTLNSVFYREKVISDGLRTFIVDLYAVGKNDISVIDFKTGDPRGPRHQEYVEQVQNYAGILQRQYRKNTQGCLIYLNPKKVYIEKVSGKSI